MVDPLRRNEHAGFRTGKWCADHFAGGIAPLAHRFQHIQGRTTDLTNNGIHVGLNINDGKTKIMKVHTK